MADMMDNHEDDEERSQKKRRKLSNGQENNNSNQDIALIKVAALYKPYNVYWSYIYM